MDNNNLIPFRPNPKIHFMSLHYRKDEALAVDQCVVFCDWFVFIVFVLRGVWLGTVCASWVAHHYCTIQPITTHFEH